LSTEEAEYVAASECTRKIVYLRQLLSKLGYPQCTPTYIHEDNQTCISFTRNDATHSYTKHIDVKYHFTPFQIDEGAITLIDTRTEDQLVNLFTEAVDGQATYRRLQTAWFGSWVDQNILCLRGSVGIDT
jgi:hypothetical protein